MNDMYCMLFLGHAHKGPILIFSHGWPFDLPTSLTANIHSMQTQWLKGFLDTKSSSMTTEVPLGSGVIVLHRHFCLLSLYAINAAWSGNSKHVICQLRLGILWLDTISVHEPATGYLSNILLAEVLSILNYCDIL